jgi:general secretion pathway protein K
MNSGPATRRNAERQRGSALIVALWVILILAMLISAFAFDMHLEAQLVTHSRQRMKARHLAYAGVEWSKMVLARRTSLTAEEVRALEGEEEYAMRLAALHLSRGVGVHGPDVAMGDGVFRVDIIPENGKRNVNMLREEDWRELLDLSGVPEDLWPALIDCFSDWTDPSDTQRLHGARQDDPYYLEQGIIVKNGPLDTVEELLLIKNFNENIVFGGYDEEEGVYYRGIAQHLTTWGDGRVNINSATRDVLLTIPEIEDEFWVDQLMSARLGMDNEPGSVDNGFRNEGEALSLVPGLDSARNRITVGGISYLRVLSVGQVESVRYGVSCVLRVQNNEAGVVHWREGVL